MKKLIFILGLIVWIFVWSLYSASINILSDSKYEIKYNDWKTEIIDIDKFKKVYWVERVNSIINKIDRISKKIAVNYSLEKLKKIVVKITDYLEKNIVRKNGIFKLVLTRLYYKLSYPIENVLYYPYDNHIEIYSVWGKFINVKTFKGNKVKIYSLDSKVTTFHKNKVYKWEFNVFRNYLFLPVDKKYYVIIKKYKDFPFLKLWIHIPYDNKTVEYIYYNHAEIAETWTTYLRLLVGRNVFNRDIMRRDENHRISKIKPTYHEIYKRKQKE